MKHGSKKMDDMVKVIQKDYGCRVEFKKKGSIMIYSKDGKKINTFHLGDRGVHPLRRFMKQLEKM
jgi:Zn/Cd-binding protein ZinT